MFHFRQAADSKIVMVCPAEDHVRQWNVREALERALELLDTDPEFTPNKVSVLFLDDEGSKYHVRSLHGSVDGEYTPHETVALLDAHKLQCWKTIGLI